MGILNKLFGRANPSLNKSDGRVKTSGERITELTGGANLVDGKQTWELAQDKKDDIECMKRCCQAELDTMEKADEVPAPFYFERVAILSKKLKDYEQEVFYCELYINTVNKFYVKHGTSKYADVRKGPTYKAITKRLPKAKAMLVKISP
ncbi:hypothetical protein [Psychromonas aquatilis]|uniref:Uncharacterized protein n=1 Tax=Psychromonas aquatilis TaxID=2005072 RepID=A0ABU9GR50_9GAMM